MDLFVPYTFVTHPQEVAHRKGTHIVASPKHGFLVLVLLLLAGPHISVGILPLPDNHIHMQLG